MLSSSDSALLPSLHHPGLSLRPSSTQNSPDMGPGCSPEERTGPASLGLTPSRPKSAWCLEHGWQTAVRETLVSRISQARERAEESSKAMYKQERRPQSAFRAWHLLPLEFKYPMALFGAHQVIANLFVAYSVLVKCAI